MKSTLRSIPMARLSSMMEVLLAHNDPVGSIVMLAGGKQIKLVQTGIGSKIVMGFHVPLTADNMANARDGEQMKCKIFGLSNLVSSRSVGVSGIRGVIYSNLVLQMNKTDNGKANESVPSMFSFIRILSPCRAMMGLVSEQPHFPPIFQELSFD
jgi:hypothetical protein